jgi:hypothetical protein
VALLSSACVGVGEARADGPRIDLEVAGGVVRDGLGGHAALWSPMMTLTGRAGATGAAWLRAGGTMAVDSAGATGFAAGNLVFGWAEQMGAGLVLKVGGALPVARRGQAVDALAEVGGRAIRGHWESWQWLGDHAAAFGSMTWAEVGPGWLFEAQPTVAFMLPTQAREGTDGLVRGDGLALELRARVAAEVAANWWVSLAGQLAWTPTVTRDAAALSVVPELRWLLPAGAHLALGAVVNLDAPWGPSWARDAALPTGALAAGRGAIGFRLSGAWRF